MTHRLTRHTRTALLCTAAWAAATGLSTPVHAQNTQAETEAEARDEQIVITGSRIARRDYTATSPIVTVDSEILEKSSSINLEANLNKLPQFSPALTQFTTQDVQVNAGNAIGASTVSLRQLGQNRNVVLIDGRRPTPVNGQNVVDINSIPSAAIERVEVISGGASSTYGADAVGGAVNFILKKNFNGIALDGQGAITQRGDGLEYRFSALFGTSLNGGQGSVMMGMEYYNRDDVRQNLRPWYTDLWRSPNVAGTDVFVNDNFVSFGPTRSGVTAAQVQPSQAAYNTLFRGLGAPSTYTRTDNGAVVALDIPRVSVSINEDPSQTVASRGLYINTTLSRSTATSGATVGRPFIPLLVGYNGGVDGLERKITNGIGGFFTGVLEENNTEVFLSSPAERYSFFAKANYDLNDDLTAFGQVSFSKNEVRSLFNATNILGTFAATIPYGTDRYLGNSALNIPSSIVDSTPTNSADDATMPTHADYRSGGKYGLNCPATGGCTNSQVFPVPDQLKALLDSRTLPLEPYLINITSPDNLGRRRTTNTNLVFQMVIGLQGKVPGTDWTWEVFGSHGESTARTDLDGLVAINRWRAVVSSPNFGRGFDVTANDTVVGTKRNGARATCATGLSPFEPAKLWSPDCRDAIGTALQTNNRVRQENAEGNLQGGLVDLPYGQLRFALGASYRKNAIDYRTDSSLADGSSFIETVGGVFPQGDTIASITAKEVYGELLVPLLADLPFAKALNLELGYRLSDYNTIGSIGTYKINGEYAPFEWLRFRGGYQRASRAPNLVELFSAPAQAFGSSAEGDPCSRANPYSGPASSPFPNYSANPIGLDSDLNPNTGDTFGNPNAAKVEALCRQLMGPGATQYYLAGRTYNNGTVVSVPQVTRGNPNLSEEKATTYTIGAVITAPVETPWLQRLRASIDYYNVVLADGIALQSADGVYRRCFSNVYNPDYELNEFCSLVARSPATGEPETIGITWSNAGRVQTSGIDVQVDWGLTFKDVELDLPGAITFNSQFTYLLEFATTTDSRVLPLRDWAGTFGGGEVGTNAGSYRWRFINTYGYSVGPVNVSLQWQHRPATKASTAVSSANNTFSGAPSYDLFNLSGTYRILRGATVRFGIDNLFDKAPPIYNINSANTPGSGLLPGGVINTAYDVLGRRFYVGASIKL